MSEINVDDPRFLKELSTKIRETGELIQRLVAGKETHNPQVLTKSDFGLHYQGFGAADEETQKEYDDRIYQHGTTTINNIANPISMASVDYLKRDEDISGLFSELRQSSPVPTGMQPNN